MEELHDWYMRRLKNVSDDYFYKKSALKQYNFIEHDIFHLCADDRDDEIISVLSEHISKSVPLPVYHIRMSDTCEVVMRGNFYDWKISVVSETPIVINPDKLWDSWEKHHPVYFEGFPREYVFGPYNDNRREFSLELPYDERNIWAFFLLLYQAIKR